MARAVSVKPRYDEQLAVHMEYSFFDFRAHFRPKAYISLKKNHSIKKILITHECVPNADLSMRLSIECRASDHEFIIYLYMRVYIYKRYSDWFNRKSALRHSLVDFDIWKNYVSGVVIYHSHRASEREFSRWSTKHCLKLPLPVLRFYGDQISS